MSWVYIIEPWMCTLISKSTCTGTAISVVTKRLKQLCDICNHSLNVQNLNDLGENKNSFQNKRTSNISRWMQLHWLAVIFTVWCWQWCTFVLTTWRLFTNYIDYHAKTRQKKLNVIMIRSNMIRGWLWQVMQWIILLKQAWASIKIQNTCAVVKEDLVWYDIWVHAFAWISSDWTARIWEVIHLHKYSDSRSLYVTGVWSVEGLSVPSKMPAIKTRIFKSQLSRKEHSPDCNIIIAVIFVGAVLTIASCNCLISPLVCKRIHSGKHLKVCSGGQSDVVVLTLMHAYKQTLMI